MYSGCDKISFSHHISKYSLQDINSVSVGIFIKKYEEIVAGDKLLIDPIFA